jgi:DNA-binding MarR family transcriptional regulator
MTAWQLAQRDSERHGREGTAVAEPRWLNSPEMAAWLNLTQLLMLLPTALDRQLRDEAGIPHAYYQILAMLSTEPGHSMRMTDLARRVGTTPSRLSHAVASLEQRGWVCRKACAFDKRGQIASITGAGMSVLESAAPGHVAEVRRLIFDRLSPAEIDQLREITGKIMHSFSGPFSGQRELQQ